VSDLFNLLKAKLIYKATHLKISDGGSTNFSDGIFDEYIRFSTATTGRSKAVAGNMALFLLSLTMNLYRRHDTDCHIMSNYSEQVNET
jgi:hypothetical protein